MNTGRGHFLPVLTVGPFWTLLLAGMTRREFCRRTRVERESLCRWARGDSAPREGSIMQIAGALGRDVAEVRALLFAIVAAGRARRELAATKAEAAP